LFITGCITLKNTQTSNCTNLSDDYIPKNLTDALNYLNCKWSDEDKEKFRSQNEDDAVAELHMGTGRQIRNEWGLWAKKKNSLVRYFNSLGIYHPDDMSLIILTSFHRQLNNVDINLEEYKKYAKEEKEIINEMKRDIKRKYKQLSIGDTIKIPFGVFRDGNDILFTVYPIYFETDNFDCIISCIVKKKNDNYILIVEVIDKWFSENDDYKRKSRMEPGELFNHNMSKIKTIID
jgi:hypothetical protein